tara:strand:+ start:682 stop:1065 length:384 start_codon:yes stop_codon:yes gene_type:complete
MDDCKHADFIARGVILDNVIDDAIADLSLFNDKSNELFKDYKVYKPAILLCNTLFTFINIQLLSKEFTKKTYEDYLDQADYGIDNFMDYVVALFTRGKYMEKIPEMESAYIDKILKQRLQKLKGRTQ